MGCLLTICRRNAQEDILDQYENLVVSKPAPIDLEAIHYKDDDDTDVPLFAEIESTPDADPIPGIDSDEEIDFHPARRPRKLD
jgi:hypothetical protein